MTASTGSSKLADPAALEKIIEENPEKKYILAGGTFDILKPSHIDLLEFAAALGDILIAAVSEEGAYTPLPERLEILNELAGIDFLITFSGKFSRDTLMGLCHRIVVSEEFQPADQGSRHSEKRVVCPG